MDNNEKIESGAGDVRSNATTIAALRQGVGIKDRATTAVLSDHCGDAHAIPMAIAERAGCITVEVSKDIIGELERRAAGPRRRTGTVQIGSVTSLIEYVNRFKAAGDVVFFAWTDHNWKDPTPDLVDVTARVPGRASGRARAR